MISGKAGRVSAIIVVLLLSSTCSLSSAAMAQAFSIEALMQELARGAEATVKYRETKHSALLKQPLELSGELRYKRPSFLEKRVITPHDERYTIDGDTLTVERKRDGRAYTIALQSQPVLWALVEGIRATLRGDAATLKRFYRIELEGTSAAWTLHLLPLGTDMAEFVRAVRLRGGAGRLRAMEVLEVSGDRAVMEFSEAAR